MKNRNAARHCDVVTVWNDEVLVMQETDPAA